MRLIYIKKYHRRHCIWLAISALPLLLFSFSQYYGYRKSKLEYVGKYQLEANSMCGGGIIELKCDNSYSILCDGEYVETGKWDYREGGDYWIVDIGKNGQLGCGDYKYAFKINE